MQNSIIQSWMSSPVISAPPDMDLGEVRKLMNRHNIRTLPVTANGDLVGIVTRRGLLRADRSSLLPQAWNQAVLPQIPIERIMTRHVITTSPTTLVPKAARVMAENKINSLPVVNEELALVGMITSSNMLRVIISEIPALKEPVRVCDMMTSTLITISPEISILEAHRLMAVERIRVLPVMDGDRLVGLVTRTDVLSADQPAWLDNGCDDELAEQIEAEDVRKIMSTRLVTVSQEESVVKAAQKMLDHKIHCLPVLDEGDMLVGILTETDLFRLITRKFF